MLNSFQRTLLKQDDTVNLFLSYILCMFVDNNRALWCRDYKSYKSKSLWVSISHAMCRQQYRPHHLNLWLIYHKYYHQIPACPFGKQTARRSQVEPRGTGQLTRTERRTQTLKKDKNRREHLARICLSYIKISAGCGCCCSSLLSNSINMLLKP